MGHRSCLRIIVEHFWFRFVPFVSPFSSPFCMLLWWWCIVLLFSRLFVCMYSLIDWHSLAWLDELRPLSLELQ